MHPGAREGATCSVFMFPLFCPTEQSPTNKKSLIQFLMVANKFCFVEIDSTCAVRKSSNDNLNYYGLGVGSGVGISVPGPYWYLACQAI